MEFPEGREGDRTCRSKFHTWTERQTAVVGITLTGGFLFLSVRVENIAFPFDLTTDQTRKRYEVTEL
jgi:hypothetical protein